MKVVILYRGRGTRLKEETEFRRSDYFLSAKKAESLAHSKILGDSIGKI